MKKQVEQKLQNELKYIHTIISNNRFEEAENLIEDLMYEYGSEHTIKFELGYLRYQQKNYDEAYEIFDNLKSKSNQIYALYYLAKIELLRENYDEAKELFNQIIINNYKNKNYALLELAKLEKYRKNYTIALDYINQMSGEDKALKNAKIIEKANIFYKQEKYIESNELINEIIKEITEKNLLDKALTTSALNYLKMQQYDESLKIINRVSFETTQTKLIKAKNFFYQNKFLSCQKVLEDILKNPDRQRDINLFETKLYLGKTYTKMRKNDEALKIYETIEEDLTELRYAKGIAYFRKNEFKKARENFEQVKEDEENYQKEALKQLLYIDIKEKKYKEAYEKYITLVERKYFEKSELSKKLQLNIYTFLSSKIDIPKLDNGLYSTKQIYHYQYNSLKRYITGQQNIEMDIDQYIRLIKKQLDDKTYLENNLYDYYIVENPEKKYSQDYLKVLTLPDTKDILYISKCDKFGYDAYEIDEKGEKIIKIESQIEKFNRRYAKVLKK